MRKNLTGRTVIIVATILLCVFGIIGFPKSKAQLIENFQRNIHLGLDLKGGSRLVLQVQVQDAVEVRSGPDYRAAQGPTVQGQYQLRGDGPQ